jgi:hypothetical protein
MFLQTVGYRFMWTNSVSIDLWKSFFGVSVVSPFSGKNGYRCFPMPFWVFWILVDTWQDSFGLGIRSSQRPLPRQDNTRQTYMPSAGFESAIPATERSRPAPLGCDYIGARTDTTQQTNICLDRHLQTRVSAFNQTCLPRLVPTKLFSTLSLLIVGETLHDVWCQMITGTMFADGQ